MNRYETGTYLTLLFDKHGTRQHVEKQDHLLAARDYAEQAISAPPYASYVITRTIAT